MNTDNTRALVLGDFAQMTLRANVAFAVRCAQRLRPFFDLPGSTPQSGDQVAALDAAIEAAIDFCQGLPGKKGQAAAAARLAGLVADETGETTCFAGYAAMRAAEAAACAEAFVLAPNDASLMDVAAAAFGAGRVLVGNAAAFTPDQVMVAMRLDVEKIMSLAHGAIQDLGPTVDPSENGPLGALWPDGPMPS